eukprot:PhF_6_TR7965/c0_g1_i5/m.12102
MNGLSRSTRYGNSMFSIVFFIILFDHIPLLNSCFTRGTFSTWNSRAGQGGKDNCDNEYIASGVCESNDTCGIVAPTTNMGGSAVFCLQVAPNSRNPFTKSCINYGEMYTCPQGFWYKTTEYINTSASCVAMTLSVTCVTSLPGAQAKFTIDSLDNHTANTFCKNAYAVIGRCSPNQTNPCKGDRIICGRVNWVGPFPCTNSAMMYSAMGGVQPYSTNSSFLIPSDENTTQMSPLAIVTPNINFIGIVTKLGADPGLFTVTYSTSNRSFIFSRGMQSYTDYNQYFYISLNLTSISVTALFPIAYSGRMYFSVADQNNNNNNVRLYYFLNVFNPSPRAIQLGGIGTRVDSPPMCQVRCLREHSQNQVYVCYPQGVFLIDPKGYNVSMVLGNSSWYPCQTNIAALYTRVAPYEKAIAGVGANEYDLLFPNCFLSVDFTGKPSRTIVYEGGRGWLRELLPNNTLRPIYVVPKSYLVSGSWYQNQNV